MSRTKVFLHNYLVEALLG